MSVCVCGLSFIMSFPPPPGLNQPPPSSLPARPPPPASTASPTAFHRPPYTAAPAYSSPGTSPAYIPPNASRSGYTSFTAFQPRSVASSNVQRTASPIVPTPSTPGSAFPPPATTYGAGYQQPPAHTYQGAPAYYAPAQYSNNTNTNHAYGPSVPRIQNPFSPATDQSSAYGGRSRGPGRQETGLDPEMEAQIAQWQSAYMSKDETAPIGRGFGRRDGMQPAMGVNTMMGGNTPTSSGTPISAPTPGPERPEAAPKTVVRSGGGQSWTDPTLLEWDPAHFRLFVGNLAGEVTDDSLLKAFARFPSIQKARVIRDKRTQKSRGYGFVSFSDGDDYFKAAREMQGKYIGSHPVLLRRATTEIRPVSATKVGKKHLGGGGGAGSASGNHDGKKVKGDGVKKPGKTKGGLKILG